MVDIKNKIEIFRGKHDNKIYFKLNNKRSKYKAERAQIALYSFLKDGRLNKQQLFHNLEEVFRRQIVNLNDGLIDAYITLVLALNKKRSDCIVDVEAILRTSPTVGNSATKDIRNVELTATPTINDGVVGRKRAREMAGLDKDE